MSISTIKKKAGAHASTLATLAATAGIFWILARRLIFSSVSYDEGFFLWEGWAINKGLIPYRDFSDFKPPLLFFTNAFALKIFGLAHQNYRLLFAFLSGGSIVSLVGALISRHVQKGMALAVAFVICSLWLTPWYHDSSLDDAESVGLAYYLWGLSLLLLQSRWKRSTDFLGGVLLSFSVFSKEPFALVVMATWIMFLALHHSEAKEAKRVWNYIVFSLLGACSVIVAWLAYLLCTKSMMSYMHLLESYIPFTKNICIARGLWKPSTFLLEWDVRFTKLSDYLIRFDLLGVAIPFFVAPFFCSRGKQWFVTAACLLSVVASLYAVTLGGCFFIHYFVIGMSGLFLWMTLGAMQLSDSIRHVGDARIRHYLPVMLVLLSGLSLAPRISNEIKAAHTYTRHGSNFSSEFLTFIQENSSPADTIWTIGRPELYVFSDRKNALPEGALTDAFLSIYPGTTDEEKVLPFYKQLVTARPKIVFLDPHHTHLQQRFLDSLAFPFLRNNAYQEVQDHLYLRQD